MHLGGKVRSINRNQSRMTHGKHLLQRNIKQEIGKQRRILEHFHKYQASLGGALPGLKSENRQ